MNRCLLACALFGSTVRGFAGESVPEDKVLSAPAKTVTVSYEFEADYSYVGGARTRLGDDRTGDISEQSNAARLVIAPRWGDGPIFRLGVDYQRYSFGLPENAPVPNTLQSLGAIVGIDFSLLDAWLVRIEAQPGVYSDFDDLSRGDWNVPFIAGASYIASADLQWIIGIGVDFNRRYPVIPAVGVRWHFSDQWTLNAVLPRPRLEYALNKELTAYVGAEIKDATYRVGEHSQSVRDLKRLNNAVVEYNEIRVGAGLAWKASSNFSFAIEGGYMPYREFNFHRADENFKTESGAAYGQVSLSASF
jgi:hypothetical protein